MSSRFPRWVLGLFVIGLVIVVPYVYLQPTQTRPRDAASFVPVRAVHVDHRDIGYAGRNLVVKMSSDDGATWPVRMVVDSGPAAYSFGGASGPTKALARRVTARSRGPRWP